MSSLEGFPAGAEASVWEGQSSFARTSTAHSAPFRTVALTLRCGRFVGPRKYSQASSLPHGLTETHSNCLVPVEGSLHSGNGVTGFCESLASKSLSVHTEKFVLVNLNPLDLLINNLEQQNTPPLNDCASVRMVPPGMVCLACSLPVCKDLKCLRCPIPRGEFAATVCFCRILHLNTKRLR